VTPVTAFIHPDSERLFFDEPLKDFPRLRVNLLDDFIQYKATDFQISYFGRDAAYTQPFQALRAQMSHIHLCLPPRTFPRDLPRNDRTCKKNQPDRDAALVYVRGLLEENRYCLLGVLYPDAHAKAREEKVMRYLARLAQAFRDEY